MPAENIISMTGVKHAPNVRFQLSSLVENPKVLSEPISKNTAPAIILGSKYISETAKNDPVILVVPSDHMIKNNEQFVQTVLEGEKLAEQGYIVTFGIKPTYPPNRRNTATRTSERHTPSAEDRSADVQDT